MAASAGIVLNPRPHAWIKGCASIPAIEYPLRYVHSGSRYVRFVVNIGDSIDWAAVNSHPH